MKFYSKKLYYVRNFLELPLSSSATHCWLDHLWMFLWLFMIMKHKGAMQLRPRRLTFSSHHYHSLRLRCAEVSNFTSLLMAAAVVTSKFVCQIIITEVARFLLVTQGMDLVIINKSSNYVFMPPSPLGL